MPQQKCTHHLTNTRFLEIEASATHQHTTGMHYHHLSNLQVIQVNLKDSLKCTCVV